MTVRVDLTSEHGADEAWVGWVEAVGLDPMHISIDPGWIQVDRDASTVSYLTPLLDEFGDPVHDGHSGLVRRRVDVAREAPIPLMPCEQ